MTTHQAPAFRVARFRGYDRAEVDAFLARTRDAAVTAEELRGVRFPLVRRGYARNEVDAFLRRQALAAEVAAAAGESRGQTGLEDLDLMDLGVAVVLRGYRCEDVDTLLARARSGTATAAELRDPDLTVDLRGYDRFAIDELLGRLADAVDGATPA